MPSVSRPEPRLILSDGQARELAEAYGTPLYVLDEQHLRDRARRYLAAFRAVAPKCELTFASKANSTLAVVAIMAEEGCLIDVASEGELRAALTAGVPASRVHLHGNNKSRRELEYAFEVGVNQIVVDNFMEIEAIRGLAFAAARPCPDLLLRLAPGVDPVTHAKISTGQADTKFGFNVADGSAEEALVRCMAYGLPVKGLHCHVGSQLVDPEAQRSGGEVLAAFAVEMKHKHGFATEVLNVGGGLGIHYTDEDDPMAVEEFCRLIVEPIREALKGSGLDPVLVQEPGRWLVGESGVTLYTVGVVKTVPASNGAKRTYVVVDGGLSDNPRPTMYGSLYTLRCVPAEGKQASEETQTVTVSGRHCETDRLFADVQLPANVSDRDMLQVLCTGAYNSAMASNYNRFTRPATAMLLAKGGHTLVQRRETWDEMFARETNPFS